MSATALPVEEWDEYLFEELQQLLTRLTVQPTTSTLRRTKELLRQAEPWLLALTQLPQEGEGQSSNSVPPAMVEINAISNLLGISQKLASVIVARAEQNRSRYPARSAPEIATYLIYQWLSQLLDFLHELLRVTISPSAGEGEVYDELRNLVEDLLQQRTAVGRAEGTLVDVILSQLDHLQKKLDGLVRTQRVVGAEYDLLVFRIKAVRHQQGKLAGILATIAEGGYLGRGHVIKLLKWLKKADRVDGLVASVLASFFVIARPLDQLDKVAERRDMSERTKEDLAQMGDEWCRDIRFLKIASNLVFVDEWTNPKLRESAKLAWALFIHSTLRHDPTSAQVGIDPHTADQFLQDAVNGEVFQFLNKLVFGIRQERGLEQKDEARDAAEDVLVKLAQRTLPENDSFLFEQLQDLIDSVIGKKNFLRNQRNREEDSSALRRSQTTLPTANYQAFLSLLAIVLKSLPEDSAQYIWDDASFVALLLDQRIHYPGPALWNALHAMCNGKTCASKAYEHIQNSQHSWDRTVQLCQSVIATQMVLFEPSPKTTKPPTEAVYFDVPDQLLVIGRLDLYTILVRHSPLLCNNLLQTKPHPFQILFDLINRETTMEVRISAFNLVTAFITSTNDPIDADVQARAVEYYERVTYADIAYDHRVNDRFAPLIGWQSASENQEVMNRTCQVTLAYLNFLTALLPGRSKRVIATLRRSTRHVIDLVFLNIPNRLLNRESEQWDLIDGALEFLQRSLASFDMSALKAGFAGRSIYEIANDLYDQPGFAVLLRLLSEKPLFEIMASIVDQTVSSPRSAIQNTVLLRVLRIFHYALDSQLVFSDVCLLALTQSPQNSHFRKPLGLQSLDHFLLGHLSNITNISLLIGNDDAEVAFVATKIVAALADSPVFSQSDQFRGEYSRSINRLAGIIDASDESLRIAQGFCDKLARDGVDLPPTEIESIGSSALKGDISSKDLNALPLVIRSTILDILLEGTTADAVGPNIAHFLLGFEFKGHEFHLQDPSEPDSRYSCLQVVLDQLQGGADIENGKLPLTEDTLIDNHPGLAAKSARLVHQLFSHPHTGRSAMVFARTMQGFSAAQLALIPQLCPSSTGPGEGSVQLFDVKVPTTADTLTSFLEFQKSVVACVALETHAFEGQGSSAAHIAETLFRGVHENESEPAITSLLSNIDLIWSEPAGEQKNLEFYTAFSFDSFKSADVDWYDLASLSRALEQERVKKQKSGAIGNQAQAMAQEAAYIVEQLAKRNRETEISLAKGNFLTAWAEMLKVALGRLFIDLVPEERQEAVLFELLDAILVRLGTDLSPGVMDILAEAVLVTLSTLVSILADFEGINVPIENLALILAKTIDVLVKPGTTENTRGNLYAAISSFLSLLDTSTHIPDDVSLATAATAGSGSSPLQKVTIAVLASRRDRFLATLSRDAIDVRDIWKTECFALLGALVGICQSERDRQTLSPLFKDGYLPLFVRSIKDKEVAIQECLSPDAANLNAFWVFEAKIAFLMTVASTRRGAEDLLDAGIFEIFAMCGFVSVQPFSEDAYDLVDTITRQHRVLIYVLQLLSRTLASLHRSPRSGAGHALSFLNAHRDSILLILRELPQNVTSLGVEESRLVISLLAMVIHKVPEDDRRSPTGFGAYHLSVLAVAAKFFDTTWTETVQADTKMLNAVASLNQVILTYLCASTSGLKAGAGVPVIINGGHRPMGSKYMPTAPSLQMVEEMLERLVENVQDLSAEYEKMSERLQDGAHPTDRELAQLEAVGLNGIATPDLLLTAYGGRSQMLLNMIESILLLSWRHLLFYANDVRGDVQPNNLSLSLMNGSSLEQSRSGAGAIKALRTVASSLRGTLERLSDIAISEELRRAGGKNDGYFGMLVRRLGELTAGLTNEGN